ncbi:MAG TPA: Rrf2 family transcriptional regulator [Gammaproteobacteria bacterium]|nr:Rrf2 family transcriptional regulator [Gammaproteobacteria bacterium]
MKLTTKGRYAVTAMLDLALNGEHQAVCLGDIAARQDISLAYLEQLFTRLRKQGLVDSVRGPGGGYRLGRPAEEITVAAIIAAVDEPLETTRCNGDRNCQRGERCLTHQLWEDLGNHIQAFLSGVTLASLARREDVRDVAARQAHPAEIPLRRIERERIS